MTPFASMEGAMGRHRTAPDRVQRVAKIMDPTSATTVDTEDTEVKP
jgi:hypothetical protein